MDWSRVRELAAQLYVLGLFSWVVTPTWTVAVLLNGEALLQYQDNISQILDDLLNGYDNRLRPDYGGPPTEVRADMNIRSMGPISEEDMAYSLDTYFRQTWVDKRLQFQAPHGLEELAVHIKYLEKIWKPDTFFYNGRMSYLHTITTPNKLLRINTNGTVLYSMRLTIKASCPMYLQYFPVDEQLCPLQFGSYAYPRDQMIYIWKHGVRDSIKTARDMRLSQFDLAGHPVGKVTVRNRTGEFSTLKVSFRLQRHMGYFLIQVYVPCTLIVILSWVSFWINREATADRVGLGITTVLTLTTLSLDCRDDLPKVPYATALDWFVIMCFGYVTATLLEFAGVHYFTKIGSGETYHDPDSEDDAGEDEAENSPMLDADTSVYMTSTTNATNHVSFRNSSSIKDPFKSRHVGTSRDSCIKKLFKCIQGSSRYKQLMKQRTSGVNSVSRIDRVSRILFPLSFIILNVMYWVAYTRGQSRR